MAEITNKFTIITLQVVMKLPDEVDAKVDTDRILADIAKLYDLKVGATDNPEECVILRQVDAQSLSD